METIVYALYQWVMLLTEVPKALLVHGWRCVPKRIIVFALICPAILLLNVLHMIGFLLDEIIFFRWHRQSEGKPVFIVGVPRSGTTYLHRLLAKDTRFTTTQTWEALLAPSICEKYLWNTVLSLTAPLLLQLRKLSSKFFKKMDGLHPLGMREAEEDFLFLISLNACFILIFLLPNSKRLWQLTEFDEKFTEKERNLILNYYKVCVRKHLYYSNRRNSVKLPSKLIYLSKNPSFSPFVESLKYQFSGARFVICLREPESVLPSQLYSLLPSFELVANKTLPPGFIDDCTSMLINYYKHLANFKENEDASLVLNEELRKRPVEVLNALYKKIGILLDSEIKFELKKQGQEKSQKQANNSYSLDALNLNVEEIRRNFKNVWPIYVGC